MIKINMQKAIKIKQEIIRKEREKLFQELDYEFMRSLEKNDKNKQSEIIQKKELLRDSTIHPSIINAKTPEELKEANPLIDIIK